jgi:hypothetical protein
MAPPGACGMDTGRAPGSVRMNRRGRAYVFPDAIAARKVVSTRSASLTCGEGLPDMG